MLPTGGAKEPGLASGETLPARAFKNLSDLGEAEYSTPASSSYQFPPNRDVCTGGGWEALVKVTVQKYRLVKRRIPNHRTGKHFPLPHPNHYIN